MKAAVLESWKNLAVKDMEKPVAGPGEAVIKMRYAGVCGSDITVYKGNHPTATAPVVVGHEILGFIDSIGPDTNTDLKVGDRVTAYPLISCGHCDACLHGHKQVCKTLRLLGIHDDGGYAEYTKASVDSIVKIPDELSDEIAALAEPFGVGFHVMDRSGMKVGNTAFIIGAGPISMVLAICAKACGASKVLMSDLNESRLALASQFGFLTMNPAKEDAMQRVLAETDGIGFDNVYEASGSKAGALLCTDACKIRGTIVPMNLAGAPVEFNLGRVSFKEMTVVGSRCYSLANFIGGVKLLAQLEKQMDLRPLVSDILPLDDAQKAVDYMINGTNICKILLKCD